MTDIAPPRGYAVHADQGLARTDSIPGASLGTMREVRILPVKCRSFFLEFRGRATQPWMSGWSRSVS